MLKNYKMLNREYAEDHIVKELSKFNPNLPIRLLIVDWKRRMPYNSLFRKGEYLIAFGERVKRSGLIKGSNGEYETWFAYRVLIPRTKNEVYCRDGVYSEVKILVDIDGKISDTYTSEEVRARLVKGYQEAREIAVREVAKMQAFEKELRTMGYDKYGNILTEPDVPEPPDTAQK